jgi:class 3 adenylate cyclase
MAPERGGTTMTNRPQRVVPAAARKRPAVETPGDMLNPQRVLVSLRSLFVPEPPSSAHLPASDSMGTDPPGPHDRVGDPIAVQRTFAFVDITGFTAYCDRHGEHEAIELLTRFRSIVRDVAGRRGVRVAKWLGDGAMLVGVDEGPVVATAAELVARCAVRGLHTHAGLATGTVLLFEGDDYVGRPANLASRLCEAAEPGEILAGRLLHPLPDWVEVTDTVTVRVTGVADLADVVSLGVADEVLERLGEHAAA